MRSGSLLKSHGSWFLKVYIGGKQRAIRLGSVREFMTKRDVRKAADRELTRLRQMSPSGEAKITLDSFIRSVYLPAMESQLRVSTAAGYAGLHERYIAGRSEAKRPLYEYRTVDVQRLLDGIAADHTLSKATLQHIKAYLSGVFRHAVVSGLRDGNPVRDCLIPKSTVQRAEPGVYTLAEIRSLLGVLVEDAKATVAVAAYAGLRLAELQGLRWTDYDGSAIEIKQTQWRGYTSDPKSRASKDWVPVIPALKTILMEYKANGSKHRYTAPRADYHPDAMFPIDLDKLGRRTIAAACKQAGIEWKGWHAFRRGLASNLFELGADDLTVQRVLRHAKVNVTRAHYIRLRDPKLTAAMDSLQGAHEEQAKVSTGSKSN
jgi:integrase